MQYFYTNHLFRYYISKLQQLTQTPFVFYYKSYQMRNLPCLFILVCLLIICLSTSFSVFTNLRNQQIQQNGPSYNLTLSKQYTILAVSSYCDRKCLQNWSCNITSTYLKNDKVTNVTFLMGTLTRAAGYVAYDQTKNLIVVSLRGSANAQNWISDFSFDAVNYQKCKDCKVHVGFMEDYKSIQQKMHKAIQSLLSAYPTAQVLATGHSMGAALSVIVGIQIKLKYPARTVQIQNIGCPRVGNPNFAQFVHLKVDRINRLVHNKDLIVHLPPSDFGYHHPAYQIFFDKPMQNYVICNQSGQDKACSNKYFPDYDPADHDFYFWDLGKILKC